MRHNLIDRIQGWRKSLKKHWIWLVFTLFFAGLGWAWLDSTEQALRQIVIHGHDFLTPSEIVSWMGLGREEEGKDRSVEVLRAKLLLHPRIASVHLERKNGGQIVVTVKEKKAELIIHTEQNLYEIDQNLSILSENDVRDTTLPILSGKFRKHSEGHWQGTRVLDLSRQIRNGLEGYPPLKDRISEFSLGEDGDLDVFLHSPSRSRVKAGSSLSLSFFRKLYATLAYFEANNQTVTLIDLRGEDAVYH